MFVPILVKIRAWECTQRIVAENPSIWCLGPRHFAPCINHLTYLFTHGQKQTRFYACGARDAWVLAVIVCLCLSDTHRYCIETAKRRITQTMRQCDTLVFCCQESLVDDPLFPLKFVLKVTQPPSNANFDQYPLMAPQPWGLEKKVQLTLIGSQLHALQRAIDKLCTLPLSPPKFNFCRKMSATKFLCVKTSSGKVVATSFVYITVHRRIAGDVQIYLKFALRVTNPFDLLPWPSG